MQTLRRLGKEQVVIIAIFIAQMSKSLSCKTPRK